MKRFPATALTVLKEFLWPVSKEEQKRIIPLACILLSIATVYNLLRPLKVTLVVSAANSGAEIIPFLKIWGILPGTFLLTFIFTKFSDFMNREKVFYSMVLIFISFYIIFLTILFPHREFFELNSIANFLEGILPLGARSFVAMIRHWHLSLFYLFAELWGNIVFNMLIWGFINETTQVSQAKRFYGILILAANSGAILGGGVGFFFSKRVFDSSFFFGDDAWEQSVFIIVCLAIVLGFVILGLFYHLNRQGPYAIQKKIKVVQDSHEEEHGRHFSMKEGFALVKSSKHVRYLSMMVIGYNITFNLIDVLWTNQLRVFFENNRGDLNAFSSLTTLLTGFISVIISLFFTGVSIRMGWRFAALVTPVIMFIGGLFFFPSILFQGGLVPDFVRQFIPPQSAVMFSVYIGAVLLALTRAFKYTLFDATKEMAFIPLPKKDQRRSKAVIDGIGSRVGKSGGSIAFQTLMVIFASIPAIIPFVGALSFTIFGLWITSIINLNKTIDIDHRK